MPMPSILEGTPQSVRGEPAAEPSTMGSPTPRHSLEDVEGSPEVKRPRVEEPSDSSPAVRAHSSRAPPAVAEEDRDQDMAASAECIGLPKAQEQEAKEATWSRARLREEEDQMNSEGVCSAQARAGFCSEEGLHKVGGTHLAPAPASALPAAVAAFALAPGQWRTYAEVTFDPGTAGVWPDWLPKDWGLGLHAGCKDRHQKPRKAFRDPKSGKMLLNKADVLFALSGHVGSFHSWRRGRAGVGGAQKRGRVKDEPEEEDE